MPSPPGEGQHPSDVLAPALVSGLCIGFSAALYHPFFGIRAALVVAALGPGLVMLLSQARRDRLSRLALAFAAIAGVATLTSRRPQASLWGEANWATGLLFVWATCGLWAWGRTLTDVAKERCRLVLFGGVLANVAVAALQRVDAVPEVLSLVDRPFGLLGNAVHLGALCAGTVAVAAKGKKLDLPGYGIVFVGAAGVQLSGGRSPLALLLLAVALIGLRTRSLATLGVVALLALAGLASPSVLPGEAPSATARAAAGEASGSFQPRLEAWSGAFEATAERPLLGHGPGRFRAATSPYRSLASAQLDGDGLFADAHNLFIEILVGTGLVGLVAFVVWIGWSARSARGGWAAVALVLLLAHLVEPLSVAITPMMALAFGMATRAPALLPVPRRRASVAVAVMATLGGVAAAATLLVAEVQLQRGSLDFDRAALASAERLLPPTWPTAALVTTRVEGFYGAQDRQAQQAAVAAGRRAVAADPTDSRSWTRLGALEAVWGSPQRAQAAYAEALEVNPWSLDGLRGAAQAALDAAEPRRAAELCRRLRQATTVGACAEKPLEDW